MYIMKLVQNGNRYKDEFRPLRRTDFRRRCNAANDVQVIRR